MVEGRVLSLQSHVVYGYVGNKSATFPLQVLGLEVDAINSVQFSNHAGYAFCKGHVTNASELEELLEGLALNGLSTDTYTHLLTGYISSASFLKAVELGVISLKQLNANLKFVCDPVLGDDGKMYVPDALLPIYRDQIIPLADIITPNQFEAELLTGMRIACEADVGPVMNWFHDKGVKTVVISSAVFGCQDELIGMASTVLADGTCRRLKIVIPRIPVHFTGTGDLFAALLLGWLHRTDHDLKTALENTVATMQAVLTRTLEHAVSLSLPSGTTPPPLHSPHYNQLLNTLTSRQLELRLVQCLDVLQQPCVLIHATDFV